MCRGRINFMCGDACGHQASELYLILSITTVLSPFTASFDFQFAHTLHFFYLPLMVFEWSGQGYMTRTHETITPRGIIMMNIGK
jgi:hypothetical protein